MRYFLFDHEARVIVATLENNTLISKDLGQHKLLGSQDPLGIHGERLNALRYVINNGSKCHNPAFPYVFREKTVREWLPEFSHLRYEGEIYISDENSDQFTLHTVWSE